MLKLGVFLVGAFLLLCGRLAWKQTLEQHQALAEKAFEPVAVIVTLLGTFLIFASIIVTIR